MAKGKRSHTSYNSASVITATLAEDGLISRGPLRSEVKTAQGVARVVSSGNGVGGLIIKGEIQEDNKLREAFFKAQVPVDQIVMNGSGRTIGGDYDVQGPYTQTNQRDKYNHFDKQWRNLNK